VAFCTIIRLRVSRQKCRYLIATAQLFFSATSTCAKWLISLEEPVPILEVRV
jgi:hypothetical protein